MFVRASVCVLARAYVRACIEKMCVCPRARAFVRVSVRTCVRAYGCARVWLHKHLAQPQK